MTLDRASLAEQVRPTREALARARHAPPEIYADPAFLALEKEKIFLRNWLFVARVEELEKPGDFLTLRILGEPVLLTCDKAGKRRAFANVCRHRGVEVAQGSGNAKRFSCPYHGWVYGLDGLLLGAPLMDGNQDFEAASCRLPELALEDWGGNLFLCFAPEPAPFASFIAPFQAEFGLLQQERCRLASKIPIELDCNWKFAVENLLDIYHVRVLHTKTFGAQFAADAQAINLRPDGVVTYFYKAGAPVPDGKSLFGRMDWIAERGDDFACTARLPPNAHLFGRCDSVRYLVIWPTAVDRCRIDCYHLFPTERFALPDFAARNQVYRDFQITVLEEDRPMVVSLQQAMSSRHYRPGPMAGLEATIHHVLNDYLDRIGL
jgi:phenylpropionate dioxygenase-like ring-hydroxylating dioxygenase large terminal subunit